MTVIIGYIKARGMYIDKWRRAAERIFKGYPEILPLLDYVQGKRPAEVDTILTALADLALLATTRQAQRMTMPLNLFTCLFLKHSEIACEINFSGDMAFLAYKQLCTGERKFNVITSLPAYQAQQVVYHAMFGTYAADLGGLGEITNQRNWATRKEMGDRFRGFGAKGVVVTFPLIQHRYYSKFCSASQTKFLAGGQPQLISRSPFSGFQQTPISEALYKELTDDVRGPQGVARNNQTILVVLRDKLERIIRKVKDNQNTLELGVVEWREMRTLDVGKSGDVVPGFVLRNTGRYFLGDD